MSNYDLNYFIEQERKGVIFAKITKSRDFKRVQGEFFPYFEHVGEVVSGETIPGFKLSTIEPLDIAYGYFHYGDQVTIVSFTELAKRINESAFTAVMGNKPNCFDVNAVFVKSVLSLNEPDTLRIFLKYMGEEAFLDNACLAACHLRDYECNTGAAFLEDFWKKDEEKKGKWRLLVSADGVNYSTSAYRKESDARYELELLRGEDPRKTYSAKVVHILNGGGEEVVDGFKRFRLRFFGKEWLF